MAWGGESKQTQDKLHIESSLSESRYVLVFKLYRVYVVLWHVLYVSCESEHMCLPVTVLHRLRPLDSVGQCRPGYLCLFASVSNGIICILWLCLHHVTVGHGAVRVQGCVRGHFSVNTASNRCDRTVMYIGAGQNS